MSKQKPEQPVLIFLDMDGVISDFDRHAEEQGKRLPNGKTDYDRLDYNWWVTMPVFKGARKFYDALTQLAPVRFLTGPVPHQDCFSGKAQWILNFVPERGRFILRTLMICASEDKRLIAGPGRILIDDRPQNIKDWIEAGGIGILHEGDYDATLAKVNAAIAAYLNPPQPRRPFGPSPAP